METSINMCFLLYVTRMRQHVKNLKEYDCNGMTMFDIQNEADVIYMKYLTGSPYSITEASPEVCSYRQLCSMLDRYFACNDKKSWFSSK